MQNAPAYPVRSADNVLRLLSMLREQGELRVAEAAAALGVAPSTAHRLLATLRQHEFAVQDRRHVYRPGPALVAIQADPPRPDLRPVVHRLLRDLVQRCQETAHFLVLEGNGVRFIDGVEGSRPLRCGTRIGLLMPAHVTSGGKALLAGLPGEELRRLYPRGLPRGDRAAISSMPALLRELAAVRRRGYATNHEESEPGITAVGRCVLDRDGRAFGAVVIAVPSVRCKAGHLDDLAGDLQVFAAAVAREL
ncbi:MAG TPA: IclR family transcriptional regulator [Streptosporangiaceae bacterium]|nr:IclR family transcriptional regulator [Streptosporangiaceae bacterium]